MASIHVLDQNTIDKIAAGEVVERPASIVKELTENAIDAGASHITVEIKSGGIEMIRVSDDGKGIPADDIRLAFLRHATSKISCVEDLNSVLSLGFRGEALSSIAAVSRVELITKESDELTAVRYVIEGGREKLYEEIGAPDGTTIVVRDIFYNTPARAKFLKTAMTEAAHVGAYVEQLALSNPAIGFEFIVNGVSRISTTGSGNLKDSIYHIYGRELSSQLLPVEYDEDGIRITGFIAKPSVSRGNRNFENYYVNGRYVKSRVVSLGIEEGYGNKLMQHRYPFTCLMIRVDGSLVDVNVHPTKMEVRFSDERKVMRAVSDCVRSVLYHQDMIIRSSLNPPVKTPTPSKKEEKYAAPAPFEKNALRERQAAEVYKKNAELNSKNSEMLHNPELSMDAVFEYAKRHQNISAGDDGIPQQKQTAGDDGIPQQKPTAGENEILQQKPSAGNDGIPKQKPSAGENGILDVGIPQQNLSAGNDGIPQRKTGAGESGIPHPKTETEETERPVTYEQQTLMDVSPNVLSPEAAPNRKIIGCAFKTYWIIEYGDKLYMIDQHAAHEKVLFTRFMKEYEKSQVTSQQVSPPMIITLDSMGQALCAEYMEAFTKAGFEIESFGGSDIKISAVPYHMSALGTKQLFLEMLDHLEISTDPKKLKIYEHRVATEACKAAVKGGDRLSVIEAKALIDELFTCEDPYHCPHGRPTIISFTEKDLEKRFKRIV